jgi:16S rRNA processing protein RimM
MHVDSWTQDPEGLLGYTEWVLRLASGERLTRRLAEGELQGSRLVARLEGIEDRDAAAGLRGAVIEVQRSQLPPPGEKQYYRADLVGLRVENLEGAALGEVVRFVDAPAGTVMVVGGAGREHWVLATPQYLRQVDVSSGLIRVDWPAELD